MKTFLQTGPLVTLALLPAVAVAQGCFSSSNTTASADAGPDAVTGMGDAQVDGPGGGSTDAQADAPADQAAPPPPAAGGTGAFGIITIGGKQKMYLPQQYLPAQYALPSGNASITVVDVGVAGHGVAGAPAQLANIDLGTTNYATATGGDSTVVIAVSKDNNFIYFIDPTTDTLTKTIQLDASYGKSLFSGGGGYVTGVAVDSAHHRAILSVWNGFAIVDLTTKSITANIQTPPTENFGFDSVHQRIISPFYGCANSNALDDAGNPLYDDAGNPVHPSSCSAPMLPEGGVMTDGLNIVDLTDDSVYTYEGPGASFDAGMYPSYDPNFPVGREPDSAAADPSTGIVVVPSEGDGWQNVIDLSKATFDKGTHTVTAPLTIVQALDYDAVAVEPNRHLAFWEQEFANTIAVANLNQANMGNAAAVQGTMPMRPDGNYFSNIGDPHGIAVTTAIATSGPVGFVVDASLQWVARIDLAAMLAAGAAEGGASLTDVQTAPFVTYLDALTPENAVPEGGTDAGDGGGDGSGE